MRKVFIKLRRFHPQLKLTQLIKMEQELITFSPYNSKMNTVGVQ